MVRIGWPPILLDVNFFRGKQSPHSVGKGFFSQSGVFGFRFLGKLCWRVGVTVFIANGATFLRESLKQFQKYSFGLGIARELFERSGFRFEDEY